MDGLPMDDQPAPDLRALAERLQGLCLAGGWTVGRPRLAPGARAGWSPIS